jgi:hypothetical protein
MSKDTRAYLETQLAMMGPSKAPNRPDPNVRWGKRVTLAYTGNNVASGNLSTTMVSSAVFKQNTPIAFGFRFGDPNNPLAPLRPFIQPGTFSGTNIAGFRVTLTRSIDAKTGPVTDVVNIAEGETMPTCELLAMQLTIAIAIIPGSALFPTTPWTIEVTSAPVDSINCDDLVEIGGWETVSIPPENPGLIPTVPGAGYRVLTSGVVDGDISELLLPANPRRVQFSIMNVGPIPVVLGFGPAKSSGVGFPIFPSWGKVALGSFPYGTLILPGITDFSKPFARYESVLDGFTGEVWGVAQTGQSPLKAVLNITEGTKPVL